MTCERCGDVGVVVVPGSDGEEILCPECQIGPFPTYEVLTVTTSRVEHLRQQAMWGLERQVLGGPPPTKARLGVGWHADRGSTP